MRVYLAWGVVVLTTIAVVLDTVFTASYRPLMSEATWADHGWPIAPLAGTGVRHHGCADRLPLP